MTLQDNTNDPAGDYTTLGAETLSWTNGVANRAVNSLTIDTTNLGGTLSLGATSNVLTLSSGAILFQGGNNQLVTGGSTRCD